jgi:hypothetical protein
MNKLSFFDDFSHKILNQSASMEDFGTPKLDLVAIVLLAWIIVYFCIWKGVKSTGKVIIFCLLLS